VIPCWADVVLGVVAPAGAVCDATRSSTLCNHSTGRLAFGLTRRVRHASIDDHAAANLRQRVAYEGSLRPWAIALANNRAGSVVDRCVVFVRF
jgi:hypothetical protein